jgi:hypothetical protein
MYNVVTLYESNEVKARLPLVVSVGSGVAGTPCA